MQIALKKASDFKVLNKVALSGGLICFVLAPLIWGFLPSAYKVLNENPDIKANPLFTVFMRMAISGAMTVALIGLWLAWLWWRADGGKRVALREMCSQTKTLVFSKLKWLLVLSVFYFGARALEMRQFLTFSLTHEEDKVVLANTAFIEKLNVQRGQNSYLGAAENPAQKGVAQKLAPVAKRTAGALGDYGYFMGLILSLLFVVKNNWLYGRLSRWRMFRDTESLKGGRLNFVGKIFWCCTAFLIVASGIMYVAAFEPLYVWPYLVDMTFWAVVVAALTSLGTDAKILGNINAGELDGLKPWMPALLGSFVVNAFQSIGTAVLALVFWFFTEKTMPGTSLALEYFSGKNTYVLLLGVCLCCSIVAPVLMLLGKNIHDAKMRNAGMARYGVSGDDWLVICGGFEPLFVVIIGLIPCFSGNPVISQLMMLVAVTTVIVVAFLKVAEVWAEKNSAIRNKIFTDVRGSTQDDHAGEGEAELMLRALRLSVLKFYDKRGELASFGLGVKMAGAADAKSLGLPDNVSLAFIENGQYFFARDDPFTNTVLGAHELYLNRKFGCCELMSLKRYFVNRKRIGNDKWKKEKRPAAWDIAKNMNIEGKESMPYVIILDATKGAVVKAEEVVRNWNDILTGLGEAVRKGMIEEYVNGMIIGL